MWARSVILHYKCCIELSHFLPFIHSWSIAAFLAAQAALYLPYWLILSLLYIHNLFWGNFTILTKFHNFDQISQFLPNFTILTKFHNFEQISQFRPNFTIFTKFHNFYQTSQFPQNFTISTKFTYLNKFHIFVQ